MSHLNIFRTKYSQYGILDIGELDTTEQAVIIDETPWVFSALPGSVVIPEEKKDFQFKSINTLFVIQNIKQESCCIVPTTIENIYSVNTVTDIEKRLEKSNKEIEKLHNVISKYSKEMRELEIIKDRTFEKMEEEIKNISDPKEKNNRISKLDEQKKETAKAKVRCKSIQGSISRYKKKLDEENAIQQELSNQLKSNCSIDDFKKVFIKECGVLKKQYDNFYIGVIYQGFRHQLDFIDWIVNQEKQLIILKDNSFRSKRDILSYCKKAAIEYQKGFFDDYTDEMEMMIPKEKCSEISIFAQTKDLSENKKRFEHMIYSAIPSNWDEAHMERIKEELSLALNIENIQIAAKLKKALGDAIIIDDHNLLIAFLLKISSSDPLDKKVKYDNDYFETITVLCSRSGLINIRNQLQNIFEDKTIANVMTEKKEKLSVVIDKVCKKHSKIIYKKIAKKLHTVLFEDISIPALIEQAESIAEEDIIEEINDEYLKFSGIMKQTNDYCIMNGDRDAFIYNGEMAVIKETLFPVIHFKENLLMSLYDDTMEQIYRHTGNKLKIDLEMIDEKVLDTVFYSRYGKGIPFANNSKFIDVWKSNNIVNKEDFVLAFEKCAELSSLRNCSLGMIDILSQYVYRIAFLKTYYPVYYMCCALNNEDSSYYMQIIDECRRIGIGVLYPDINKAKKYFSVSDQNIYYGLASIKGVGQNADLIIKNRQSIYKDFIDFLIRNYKLNPGVIHSLIEAGAFECFVKNRTYLLKKYDQIKNDIIKAGKYTEKLHKTEALLQAAIDSNKSTSKVNTLKSEIGYIQCHLDKILKTISVENINSYDINQNFPMERKVLSAYLSKHPLDEYTSAIRDVEDISMVKQGMRVKIAGNISSLKIYDTKYGKRAKFLLEDKTGNIWVICPQNVYEKFISILKNGKIVKVYGYAKQDSDVYIKCNFIAEVLKNKKQVIISVENMEEWTTKVLPFISSCRQEHGREILIYNKDNGMIIESNILVSDTIFNMGYPCVEVKQFIKP